MKSFISISLAILLFALSTRDLAIFLSFKIFQETITEKYCVNINEPVLMCSGNCFLAEVYEVEKKSEKTHFPFLDQIGKIVYYYSNAIPEINAAPSLASKHVFYLQNLNGKLYASSIFRPPTLSWA